MRALLNLLRQRAIFYMAAGLVLASGAGFLSSQALGFGTQTRTITITLSNGARGATGPAGPQGERGPQGAQGPPGAAGTSAGVCPSGYTAGRLVINHPGGQLSIWTCIED